MICPECRGETVGAGCGAALVEEARTSGGPRQRGWRGQWKEGARWEAAGVRGSGQHPERYSRLHGGIMPLWP